MRAIITPTIIYKNFASSVPGNLKLLGVFSLKKENTFKNFNKTNELKI